MPEAYSKPCQIFKVMRHIENPGVATTVFGSSHRRCSIRKGALKNFTKFTGKHLCQSLFFNEVAGLRPQKQASKTSFLQNTSGRLLLSFRHFQAYLGAICNIKSC